MTGARASTISGIAVTLAALVALGLLATDPAGIEQEAVPTTILLSEPASRPAPVTTVITTPAPEIEGLSESVTRVLVTRGFAADENDQGIPPSIVAVLSDRNIALTIAENG